MRLIAVAFNAVAAVGGDDCFHRHFVHGQCAGLVRTHHGHRAKRFNRRQLADNCPLARHRLYAERQDNRDNRRQAFRHRRHREANQRQQQLTQRDIAQREAEEEQRHHHCEDDDKNRFPQFIHLHQQRSTVLFNSRHHLIDVA